MVWVETKLVISDNSGVRVGKCIKALRASRKIGAKPANILILSVQRIKNTKRYTKGDLCRAVLIRLKRYINRPNGLAVSSIDNSAILIDVKNIPLASRIFGPVFKEITYGNFPKVVSVAKTII